MAPWSVLIVDDDAGVRQSLRLCLEAMGARALGVGATQAAYEAAERTLFDVIFLDLWLGAESGLEALPQLLRRQPSAGVVVVTAFATFESAVEAMKRGASDYLPKPFTPEQVRLAAQRILDARRLRSRVSELEAQVAGSDANAWFDSQNRGFLSFLETARRAANSDAVVLLRGESGTGKNVLARWLRDQSPRRDGPFVTVHCPALSSELMSSALFGHRKGAFTGAVSDAVGKVQEAQGGTLFLDEVGDLSLDAQARLLRFLQDQTYERLGEARERKADVRIIAATNRPIEALVEEGRFREDLRFRLDVLSLTLPSLRERREDIPELARHYLRFFAGKQGRPGLRFAPRALEAMAAHRWPGNLRELRNCIERATILAPGDELQAVDLGLQEPAGARVQVGALVSLEELEREHIAQVIARTPSLEFAARTLGIDATTLQRKRKRYGFA
jgi:NtrC-family two-component system response regulator AlgB